MNSFRIIAKRLVKPSKIDDMSFEVRSLSKEKILIVDDVELNREILVEILKDNYELLEATNGFDAMEIIINNADDLALILLDIMMPEMDGFEVMDILSKSGLIRSIPIIVITASGGSENEIRGLKAGASDFVNKPFHPEIVKCRVDAQVELKRYRSQMENLVETNVQKVFKVRETMVDFLASVIEYRHTESGEHVQRTRIMAERLIICIRKSHKMDAELMRVNTDLLVKAIPLHDVGKISIPDQILLKPGKLTTEEFEIMKEHTWRGAEIIKSLVGIEDPEYIQYCYDISLYHHERWDGTGYPHGLKEYEIPFSARVMAIIDVYDALLSARVYKPSFSVSKAIEIIRESSGSHFDPVIAGILLENYETLLPD